MFNKIYKININKMHKIIIIIRKKVSKILSNILIKSKIKKPKKRKYFLVKIMI